MTKLSFDQVSIIPKFTEIESRKEINLTQDLKGLKTNGVIVANMDTTGTMEMAKAICPQGFCVALHKYYKKEKLIGFLHEQPKEVLDRTFITIGSSYDDFLALVSLTINTEVEIKNICMDIANGYMKGYLSRIKEVRSHFPKSFILAGNVCTPEGTEKIFEAGADCVKVGLASGGVCSTKSTTGIFYPQFSAVKECYEVAKRYNKYICSDGGIKSTGDICKAMGGGANLVMCGSLFTGYDECEVNWHSDVNGKYMSFYGMSSEYANQKYNGGLKAYRAAEGIEIKVPYKGNINSLLQQIKGGIASCCAYTNFKNLQDMIGKQDFIQI